MRRIFGALVALSLVAAAPAPGRVSLQLDAVPVSELVTILYRDVLRTPYVVAPEVSTDHRTVSIRLVGTLDDARAKVVAYLHAMGLTVTSVAGVDQISSSLGGAGLSGALGTPLSVSSAQGAVGSQNVLAASGGPSTAKKEPIEVGLYLPRYRSSGQLSDVIRGVFPDLKLGTRQQGQRSDDTVQASNQIDALVFSGSKEEVAKAKDLAAQLDTQEGEFTVKATVYEVQTGHTNQSALSVALSVLGGKVLGGYSTAATALDTFLHLKTRNVDAVVSALSSDNRFKVVTAPSVRARSGTQAVLNSGSQVPVLGSVSYQGTTGQPVQSVDYRDSGVILKVTPTLRRDIIDVDVDQEISSFAQTTTGVNDSPTLNTRSLVNSLSVHSGEVIVMGGLTEDSQQAARSGLFKGLIGSRTKTVARTEILLVLQVVALGGETDRPQRSEDGTERDPSPTSL